MIVGDRRRDGRNENVPVAEIRRDLETPLAADQPVPRTDQNSRLAHAQLLEKARSGRIDVYFAGDSITRRWGATDYPDLLAHWRQTFFGWNAANFGWGGDTTHNILWRLENGELDGVNPKVIVLQAGTNNLARVTANRDDILREKRELEGRPIKPQSEEDSFTRTSRESGSM